MQHICAADVVVVFDAVDYGCAPGTLRLIEDDAVPEFMAAKKMSLHQTGFQEVLAMARLLSSPPERLLLVGVQPAELEDYGGSLRAPVRAQVEPAMAAAVAYLEGLGVAVTRRDTPLPEDEGLAPPALALEAYEARRPSESVACRVGDARVLGSPDYQVRYHPETLDGPSLRVDVAHHLDKYR